MRKTFIIVLSFIILIGVTSCSNQEKVEETIIKEFSLAEGCYSKENNSENLICFTKDLSFYEILYKYGTYYNDPYYSTSYPEDNDGDYYEYEHEGGVITLRYYSKNSWYNSLVCVAENSNTLKCSGISDGLAFDSEYEEVYTKIEEDFDKETIEALPIFERKKEFSLVFNDEILTCNLSRTYSIIERASFLDIKHCLEEYYDKEYTITQLDKSGNWHIYNKWPSGTGTEYITNNYSYKVTVNGQTFGWLEAFPIDPYNTDEIMTVNIEKVNTEI